MIDFDAPVPSTFSDKEGKHMTPMRELLSMRHGASFVANIPEGKETSLRNSLNRAIRLVDKDRLKMKKVKENGVYVFRVWRIDTEQDKIAAWRG